MKKLLLYVFPLAVIFALAHMLPSEAGVTPSSITSLRAPTPVLNGPILAGHPLNVAEVSILSPLSANGGAGLQRPVGSLIYAQAGNGAYVKTGPLATNWEFLTLGSIAGSANAAGARVARAAALTGISASLITCAREDYVNGNQPPQNTVAIAGTGSATSSTGDFVGGRILVSTGASASSFVVLSSATTIFGRPDTNRFYYGFRASPESASDGQTNIGVGVAIVSFLRSILIGSCGATSTANWTLNRDGSTACGGTVTDLGVALPSPGVFTVGEMWSQADGKIHIALNGTEVTGSPFTMAASPVNSMRTYTAAVNGTTAANRGIDIDWWTACWSET